MADYRGRTVVMTFVYSTCKDTCPAQVQSIRGALDRLGHDVPVLAVSVDPRNDTRARAKALPAQAARHRARRASCSARRRELAPVWRGYGIAPQRGSLDHSAYVVVVDGAGPPAHRLPPLRADARGAGVGPQAAGLAATASCAASSRSAAARYVSRPRGRRRTARCATHPRPLRGRRSMRRRARSIRAASRLAAEDQLPRVGHLVQQQLQLVVAHLSPYSHLTHQRLPYSFDSVLSCPAVTDLADEDHADEEQQRRDVGERDEPVAGVGEDDHRFDAESR